MWTRFLKETALPVSTLTVQHCSHRIGIVYHIFPYFFCHCLWLFDTGSGVVRDLKCHQMWLVPVRVRGRERPQQREDRRRIVIVFKSVQKIGPKDRFFVDYSRVIDIRSLQRLGGGSWRWCRCISWPRAAHNIQEELGHGMRLVWCLWDNGEDIDYTGNTGKFWSGNIDCW